MYPAFYQFNMTYILDAHIFFLSADASCATDLSQEPCHKPAEVKKAREINWKCKNYVVVLL